jgi:SSS family solute:Na+ symporter
MLGLFWKKTTNAGAIWGALASIPIALGFKMFPEMPWMNQMGLTALATMLVIIVISLLDGKGADNDKGIKLTKDLFKTDPIFNIAAFAISIILVVLYAIFW